MSENKRKELFVPTYELKLKDGKSIRTHSTTRLAAFLACRGRNWRGKPGEVTS